MPFNQLGTLAGSKFYNVEATYYYLRWWDGEASLWISLKYIDLLSCFNLNCQPCSFWYTGLCPVFLTFIVQSFVMGSKYFHIFSFYKILLTVRCFKTRCTVICTDVSYPCTTNSLYSHNLLLKIYPWKISASHSQTALLCIAQFLLGCFLPQGNNNIGIVQPSCVINN